MGNAGPRANFTLMENDQSQIEELNIKQNHDPSMAHTSRTDAQFLDYDISP